MEKEVQTDSDQRGEGRAIMGERRGRVKSRNVYKGPTEKDNGAGGGFNVGCGGCVGHGRVMGGKWDNCN